MEKDTVYWEVELGQLSGNIKRANTFNDAVQAGLNLLNEFNGRPKGIIWIYFENPDENIYTEDFQIVKSDGRKMNICDNTGEVLQTMKLVNKL